MHLWQIKSYKAISHWTLYPLILLIYLWGFFSFLSLLFFISVFFYLVKGSIYTCVCAYSELDIILLWCPKYIKLDLTWNINFLLLFITCKLSETSFTLYVLFTSFWVLRMKIFFLFTKFWDLFFSFYLLGLNLRQDIHNSKYIYDDDDDDDDEKKNIN